MIRISDPARLGPALGEIRELLGVGKRDLAAVISATTGRPQRTVEVGLWRMESGAHQPDITTVLDVLDALGYDLALVPRDGEGQETAPASTESAQGPSAGGSGSTKPVRKLSGRVRRLRECVERWPGAEIEGDYDPRCCWFPKSCSASVYDPELTADEDLEDA